MRLKVLGLMLLMGPVERAEALEDVTDEMFDPFVRSFFDEADVFQYAAVVCTLDEAAFERFIEVELTVSTRWYNEVSIIYGK